jgi:hypothetical protein
LGLFVVADFHERKPPRLARETVAHDIHTLQAHPSQGEQIPQIFVRGLVRNIPHVELHVLSFRPDGIPPGATG